LRVCSFNHPSEIAELGSRYDVEWVPVEATSAEIFGRHYIPVNAVVDWAAGRDATFLLINSDIELRVTAWEMKRIRWLSDGGLCYVVRHNHRGNETAASPEPHGIDAFLFHGRDAGLVPGSFLSIGQPFWDYYLPHLFATAGRDISTLDFRAAYHRDHGRQWSWENWHRCALEFHRVTGSLGSDSSVNACLAMSQSVRRTFDRQRKLISAQPMMIRDWVTQKFGHPAAKTFLELGSHLGTDTAWMAALPNVTIHAFEPDPRNRQPARSNVIQHQLAIAGSDDRVPFNLSLNGWGQEWTYSSSIKQPKNHLHHYPVTFGETVEVETITLDTYRRQAALEHIDLIWADIQGAEGEMISGGAETLRRTRYLFTEYSDDEMYEGQVSLGEIVRMLPGFRIVELWPDDVLLENRALVP
jgi:FkbM family methyltransferase